MSGRGSSGHRHGSPDFPGASGAVWGGVPGLSQPGARICSPPALRCQMGQETLGCRSGRQECPQGAGLEDTWGTDAGGDGRCGGRAGLGTGVPRGCKRLCRGLGAATLPGGCVDSSAGTKGPCLCHRGVATGITWLFALLFWRWLCPHPAHEFFSSPEPRVTEVDRVLGGMDGAGTESPGCPLLPPRDRGGSRGRHTAPRTQHGDRSRTGQPRAPELPPPRGVGSWGCGRARPAAQPRLQPSASSGSGA